MPKKNLRHSGRIPQYRPSKALRFRIDAHGSLRAMLSASSGEFQLTPEIIELLCLLQKGVRAEELGSRLRKSFRDLTQNLPEQAEIDSLLEDLEAAQCVVDSTADNRKSGIEDGFGDAWIQWAMLADAPRCQAYRTALLTSVGRSSRVVDVGAGSGLLSLYALEAGATMVNAIEETAIASTLKKMSSQLPEEMRKRFKMQTCNSSDAELPADTTHVVSELFGNDPFQEGIIPTLRDVFARIENAKCIGIPKKCSVIVQLASVLDGPLKSRLQRLSGEKTEPGHEWFEAVRRIKKHLDLADVSFAHPIRFQDIKFISHAKTAFSVPLAPPPALSAPRPQHQCELTITENSATTVLIVGFRAELIDKVTISNLPGADDACEHWSPILIPLFRPVLKNEHIRVQVSVAEQWEKVVARLLDASGEVLGARQ